MKKILMVLLASLNLFFLKAQTPPSGVLLLGDSYVDAYYELVNKLGQIEKDLYTRKNSFGNINELSGYVCSEWGRLSGTACEADINQIAQAVSSVEPGGTNYDSIISGSGISENFKTVLRSLNASIQNIQAENDMITVLDSFAKGLENYRLTDLEKRNFKTYLTGLYATNQVFLNSLIVKEKTGLMGKSFWGWVAHALKCVGGTVGSALIGGLAGAGTGTFTVPVVGNVSGAIIGVCGGALTGMAQFCF